MKMTHEDFAKLKAALAPTLAAMQPLRAEYEKQGFSAKRFRWDVLHASRFNVCALYSYLDDDHIDTALKAAVR